MTMPFVPTQRYQLIVCAASMLGAEVAAASRAVAALRGEPIVVGDPVTALDDAGRGALDGIGEHRIVVVRRGPGTVDDRWPRDPAERRRRPWS